MRDLISGYLAVESKQAEGDGGDGEDCIAKTVFRQKTKTSALTSRMDDSYNVFDLMSLQGIVLRLYGTKHPQRITC